MYRKSVRLLLLAIAFGSAAFALPARAAEPEVLSMPTRPGVTVEVRLREATGARVAVLLFEGGSGRITPASKGFASLAARLLAARGLTTALVDAPSDQTGYRGGMPPGFRYSSEHLADIDAVLAALKQRSDEPWWLLGISRETQSAANYAVRRPGNRRRRPAFEPHDAEPRPPGHRVAAGADHRAPPRDRASGRRLSEYGAGRTQQIVEAARASPGAEAMVFARGSSPGGNPCRPRTHHTFHGIEDEVIAAITDFIEANTP